MNDQQVTTPEQALSLLDTVAARYKGERSEHQLLVQAVQLLHTFITSNSVTQSNEVIQGNDTPNFQFK